MIMRYSKTLLILLIWQTSVGMSYVETPPISQQSHDDSKYTQHTSKPRAAIEIDYSLNSPLPLGVEQLLEVSIRTGFEVESLVLDIGYDLQGLTVSAPVHYEYQQIQRVQLSLPVTGLQQGHYFLEVSAVYQHQGEQQARSFAIPLTVGEVVKSDVKESSAKTTDSADAVENVFSQPAVESGDRLD